MPHCRRVSLSFSTGVFECSFKGELICDDVVEAEEADWSIESGIDLAVGAEVSASWISGGLREEVEGVSFPFSDAFQVDGEE